MTAPGSFRALQRQVALAMYTRSGWIEGHAHVPGPMPLLDFLNKTSGFINLTDVAIRGQQIPFMALRKDAVFCLAPPRDEPLVSTPGSRTALAHTQCVFVLEVGIVHGTIELLAGARVSDHVEKVRGMITVRQVTAAFDSAPAGERLQYPLLLINPHHIIGVSDQTRP